MNSRSCESPRLLELCGGGEEGEGGGRRGGEAEGGEAGEGGGRNSGPYWNSRRHCGSGRVQQGVIVW